MSVDVKINNLKGVSSFLYDYLRMIENQNYRIKTVSVTVHSNIMLISRGHPVIVKRIQEKITPLPSLCDQAISVAFLVDQTFRNIKSQLSEIGGYATISGKMRIYFSKDCYGLHICRYQKLAFELDGFLVAAPSNTRLPS